jgi:hypothetical protein
LSSPNSDDSINCLFTFQIEKRAELSAEDLNAKSQVLLFVRLFVLVRGRDGELSSVFVLLRRWIEMEAEAPSAIGKKNYQVATQQLLYQVS